MLLRSLQLLLTAAIVFPSTPLAAQDTQVRTYNTVKEKLSQGKKVVGGTITTTDPDVYCAMAEAGYDFLWIEMQHYTMTYDQAARMIWACKDAPAIPFIRIPDATEGDIQKAVDLGALGVIVPMVDTVEEIRAAVKYAKYPPEGRRSKGGGQYRRLYGPDYRETANDNIMIVIMIETNEGIELIDELVAVPGVDVVFAASGDLESFTGWKRTEPRYLKMVDGIRASVTRAGRVLGGPWSWRDREGFRFFQASSQSSLIGAGAKLELSGGKPKRDVATGDETR